MPLPYALRAKGVQLQRDTVRSSVYRLNRLEPGRYGIGVTRTWDGPVVATAVVEVGGGTAVVTVALPPVGAQEGVEIRAAEGVPPSSRNLEFRVGLGATESAGGFSVDHVHRMSSGSYFLLYPPGVTWGTPCVLQVFEPARGEPRTIRFWCGRTRPINVDS
jgi:hypothetical protein